MASCCPLRAYSSMSSLITVLLFLFVVVVVLPHCSSAWTNKVEGPVFPFLKHQGKPHASIQMTITQQLTRHHPLLKQWFPSSKTIQNTRAVEEVTSSYGMPWKSSIDPAVKAQPFYMPFWEWQLEYMKDTLTNLRPLPTTDGTGTQDLTYVEQRPKASNEKSTTQYKRMITLCFESDEYRLIRMTLFDGGSQTQVFTSAWYPRGNLPILGIDLLQFPLTGKQKKELREQGVESMDEHRRHLTIADFQPIHAREVDHDALYEDLLRSVRSQYPHLQGEMTTRFYHPDDPFFSSQMLLGRDTNPEYVWKELFPAVQAYVDTHVQLAGQTMTVPYSDAQPPVTAMPSSVLDRHVAYDNYSAERDPAHGLLSASFGQDYADQFMYSVLFPLSTGKGRKKMKQTSRSS